MHRVSVGPGLPAITPTPDRDDPGTAPPTSSLASGIASRTARHPGQRDNLIGKIGELTYAQRTDTAISCKAEIAALVEEIRHLERTEELRHRNSRVTANVYARWIQPGDSRAAAVVPDYSQTLRVIGK